MAQGHIRAQGKRSWEIKFDAGRDPVTGRRLTKYVSFKGTKRAAQNELTRLLSTRNDGSFIEPSKETMATFLSRWLEHMRAHVSPRTHERYTEIVDKNLVPAIGAVLLTKLQPQQIDTAYAKALSEGRRDGKGGLSPRSVHHMHRVLKQALQQAVRWRNLVFNPCDAVKPPKVGAKLMQTYDMAQTVELIEAMRGTRMLAPTLLAVLCGLRRGEIAALRWRNVDLLKGDLAIVESAEQTKAGIRYKEPKGGRSRTVALSATMVEELRRRRLAQIQELLRLGARLTDDSFVAAQADGSPLQPRSLTHEWARLIAKTTLPRIRFHDLRHAHATHLLASGVHPKVASERLGHSKVGITLDLYSHVLPGMQADAAAKVDDAYNVALQSRAKRTE
ncbi:MAG TPA: tyrosine-type recombinase/integrase [Pseudolabrys sp.]